MSISYYGIFTWMPARLAGEASALCAVTDFWCMSALAQLPGCALAAYGVEKWGRRPTLIGFLLLSAAGCTLFISTPNSLVVGVAILLMSFALLGTWGGLYAFTPELYPTESRGTGMGAAGSMARLGGLLAPSALSLVIAQSFTIAIALFAGPLILAAFRTYFIDVETREKPLL